MVGGVDAQSLGGSPYSLTVQNRMARTHDFSYLKTSRDVYRFVEMGLLVPIRGNADYELARVSFPYARPEVALFIQRLSRQYHAACGEKLVVTSLTRPTSRQPRNASDRSVHPTGMAIDLRRSNNARCRSWLESTLVSLERQRVVEATRERYPPHYHVAVFPKPYVKYVATLEQKDEAQRGAMVARASSRASAPLKYEVRRGDSLWTIARVYGVTVDHLKATNALDGSQIYAGQVIRIPAR